MKALIIAAGKGSRLKSLTKGEPKPLIRLLGLSLIERVILTAKKAGVDEFVIVIGCLGEKIKEELADGNRHDVRITYIENRQWQNGNGVSVLKAKDLLNEKFVLLMSDHIFDGHVLKGLIDYNTRSSVVLAVDRRKPLAEDTKVLENEGKIADIGKNIEKANCIDTGIFLCSPKIFSYIEEAVQEGKTELADGIAKAAKNRDAQVFDITQIESYRSKMRKEITPWWVDIDTEEDLRKAEQYLIEGETRYILHENVIYRKWKFIGDKIREAVATLILKLPVSINPNHITIASFLLGILSAIVFAISYPLVGAALYYISDVLDGADGVVARRTGRVTSYGAYLDSCLDRYIDTFVFLGICVYLSHFRYIWVIGILAIIGSFMMSYTIHRAEALGKVVLPLFIPWGRRTRMQTIIVGVLLGRFYGPSLLFYTLIVIASIGNLNAFWRMMPWMLKDFDSVNERTRKVLRKTSIRKFQRDEDVI